MWIRTKRTGLAKTSMQFKFVSHINQTDDIWYIQKENRKLIRNTRFLSPIYQYFMLFCHESNLSLIGLVQNFIGTHWGCRKWTVEGLTALWCGGEDLEIGHLTGGVPDDMQTQSIQFVYGQHFFLWPVSPIQIVLQSQNNQRCNFTMYT